MSYWIPDFRRLGFVELQIMRTRIGSFFYINPYRTNVENRVSS